jgi:hypothetical protein
MLLGILGHVGDDDEAQAIVRRLLAALPSGSYLTVCDGTNIISEAGVEAQRLYNESGAVPYRLRTPDQIAAFFEGLELVEPGGGVVHPVAARHRRAGQRRPGRDGPVRRGGPASPRHAPGMEPNHPVLARLPHG